MAFKIHPSVFLRGSFALISICFVLSVFLIQPYFEKYNNSVQQVEQWASPEKEITPIDPKYHKALTTNHRLFIILISSNSTIGRVPHLMETWGSAFIQTRFSAGLFFEFLENRNKTYYPYKNIPYIQKYKDMMESLKDKPNAKDINLAIKEINALDYYVHNTKAEWLFRGVDDTFVNMNEFPRFFTSLPDPTGKALLYGDCIESPTPYLHGGSGILMSREMAKKLLNHSSEWLKEIESPEEVYFSKLIESAGFDVSEFGSPYFMGIFNKNEKDFDNIDQCKALSKSSNRKCPDVISNVKKTIFFHDSYHKMTMDNWTSLVEEGPDNLNWLHGKKQERFCY